MHGSELYTDSFVLSLSRSFLHHVLTKVVEFAIQDYGQAKSLTGRRSAAKTMLLF